MQNRLLPIAGVLVFVSAAIHLALGITGLAEAFSGGGSASLPALYLLGGLAALVLLAVLALTPVATTAYVAGAGLMVLFLLAYADVHAFGVAESILGVDPHGQGAGSTADHGTPDGHDQADHAHAGDGHDGGHSHDHAGEGHSHDPGHGDDRHGHGHNDGDHDGHEHGTDPVDDGTPTVLVDHLREDAYALASKGAEAGAAAVLVALAVLDR